MKKTTKAAGVLAVSVIAFMLSSQPAFADNSYVPDAVAGLSNSSVYVDSDVSLTDAGQIASALDGTDVSVVVLPTLALDTYTANDIASMIRQETGDDTIVVVADYSGSNDRVGVSSKNNQNEITTVLNESLAANNGDAGSAINSTIQEVTSLSSSSSQGGNDALTSDGGFSVLPVVLVFALISGSIYGGITISKRKKKGQRNGSKNDAVPTNFSDLMPSSLVPMLKQLSDLMRKHNELEQKSLTADIKIIIDNLQELFTRLKKKGTESQQRMAEVEYEDKLPKLIEALGPNYYIDIVEHNELWDNSNSRLQAVAEAAKAVQKQLLENIRQVNASKDLEFQVALDSLVRSANPTTIDDVFKNKS
jgi:hypothetical protein